MSDLRNHIPLNTLEDLDAYVDQRHPVSGFLNAVLSNDLQRACGKADEGNRAALCWIVDYVFNCLPGACRGSPEKVRRWLERRENEPEAEAE